jgi:hypothetical protein
MGSSQGKVGHPVEPASFASAEISGDAPPPFINRRRGLKIGVRSSVCAALPLATAPAPWPSIG